MKKGLKLLIFTIFIVFLTGCGITRSDDVIGNFEKKLNKSNSYYIEGLMQIINNEDTYDYEVKVSYKKDDYYKIELINKLNNHEQVILRNDDGVYVITPSLNKSFKFQSDWPYNNSQVYLLNSVLEDLKTDEERTFKTIDNGYVFTSKVHYPNNKMLKKQNVYINKDSKINKVEVVDNDNNVLISMTYQKQEFDKKFDDNYFELNSIIKNNTNTIDNNNNKNNQENNTIEKSNTEETLSIKDVIYPMYLPENTYLTGQDRINTDTGERLILTFGGVNSFVLVDETISSSDNNLVIPVTGNFDFLSDVIGVISTNSVMWQSNGIEYYLTSNTMDSSTLVEIARSISVLPVSK